MNISTAAAELRALFLKFMQEKGHALIPSASVIPENDPTVLFTTAGMHPLVPYLMGAKHPDGHPPDRRAEVRAHRRHRRCGRRSRTCTFFEMLGNWSLGDYFKKEAISWSWEFLTSPEYLGLDQGPAGLLPCLRATRTAPRDEESPRPVALAWAWRRTTSSTCPRRTTGGAPPASPAPAARTRRCSSSPTRSPAARTARPRATAAGTWRSGTTCSCSTTSRRTAPLCPWPRRTWTRAWAWSAPSACSTAKRPFTKPTPSPASSAKIAELSGRQYGAAMKPRDKAFRIIADHMRTATFILGDDRGVSPSNADQGYVLRRLIRRAVRYGMQLDMPEGFTSEIARVIIAQYQDVYPELARNSAFDAGTA